MSNLNEYYKDETIYQRLVQAGAAVGILESAGNRIRFGTNEYKNLTGEIYSYSDASYPEISFLDLRGVPKVDLDNADLLADKSDPITLRLHMVGEELLVGKEALTVESGREVKFTTLEDTSTARDKVEKLVGEAARLMDDLIVKLAELKLEEHSSALDEGASIHEYMGGSFGLDPLMMSRVALGGGPPDKFFDDIQSVTGKEVDGLRGYLQSMEKDVQSQYGAPQSEHFKACSVQDGLTK